MKRLRKIAVVIISLLVVLYLGLVIVALLPQETIPISTLSGPQDKFIMVNGQTIHYLKQGNGKPLRLIPLTQVRLYVVGSAVPHPCGDCPVL